MSTVADALESNFGEARSAFALFFLPYGIIYDAASILINWVTGGSSIERSFRTHTSLAWSVDFRSRAFQAYVAVADHARWADTSEVIGIPDMTILAGHIRIALVVFGVGSSWAGISRRNTFSAIKLSRRGALLREFSALAVIQVATTSALAV